MPGTRSLVLFACLLLCAPAAARAVVTPGGALAFEENRGQLPEDVRYRTWGHEFQLLLGDAGATLVTRGGPGTEAQRLVLRVRGARGGNLPKGESPLAGRLHYYRGEPEDWVSDVPLFGRVRYGEILPGIDLVFHDHANRVEYDFVVAPGADPSAIALELDGARGLSLDDAGRLHVALAGTELVLSAPVLYQEQNGVREPVAGAYRLASDGSAGFDIGRYDAARALVIDPVVLGYSTRLGGSNEDEVKDMTIDAGGAIHLAGLTRSTSFVVPSGAATLGDAFVAKVSADGSTLVYAAIIGGSAFDQAWGIATDAAGNAYAAGQTESTDFPPLNAYQPARAGVAGNDAFFLKLDPAGTLLYSTYYGGSGDDGLFDGGVDVHASGRVYLASRSDSITDLPLSNAFQSACAVECAFVAGFDPSQSGASSFVYGSYVGGDQNEGALALGVDASEQIYVFGFTGSDNDLVVAGQGFQDSTGDVAQRDHFLVVLDPANAGLAQRVYSTYIGGLGDEVEEGDIHLGAGGLVWVVGETDSTAPSFPVKNAFQAQNAGLEDGYVLKADTGTSGAGSLLWSTFLGGSAADKASGVGVDASDRVYIAASSSSFDYPVLFPIPPFGAPGGGSPVGVLVSLSPDGQTQLLGTPVHAALRVEVDSADRPWVAGNTIDPLIPMRDALPPSPVGGREIVLARFDPVPDGGLRLEVRSTAALAATGETYAYLYLLDNRGDVDATDVELTTDFPVGLGFVSASANCTFPGANSVCDLFDPIPPGTNEPVYLLAQGPAPGAFGVNASVTGTQPDPDPGDNSDSGSVTVASVGSPAAPLRLADFDAVSNTFDIGEFSLDTPRGVLGTANGSFDGAVNFMVFDGEIEFSILEVLGLGEVAFGFVERATWTPTDGDGGDLFGAQFNAPADRVFATVDEFGFVSLYTADAFDPGRLIGQATVSLDPAKKFRLVVDKIGSNAQVIYGGNLVLEGDPFTTDPSDADPADVGDDQVITISFGTEFRGSVTLPEPGGPLGMFAGSMLLGWLARRRRGRLRHLKA